MRISEIRAKNIHEVVEIIGEIYHIEEEHRVIGAKWECQSCGTINYKLYSLEDEKFIPPDRCVCGRRKFYPLVKDVADIKKIKIKEFATVMGISNPMSIWIPESLLNISLKKGDKVKIKGTIVLSKKEENPYALIASGILKI